MLADPAGEVVYVSTPIGLHAFHGRSVLNANKHFWCEKPLAETLADVLDLESLSRERGLSLAEGYMYLYHPQFGYLRELVDSGVLGQVRSITCRFGIPPLERPGFRSDPELGGGAFLDVGSYLISATTALFRETTPAVLYSRIDTASGSRVNTGGQAVLRSQSGVYITLEWGVDCAYRNEIDVWGSEGSVSSDRIFSKAADYVPRFRFVDLKGREEFRTGRAGNHFGSMFESFRTLVDNPLAAEGERGEIVRRAHLMNEIATARH